MNIRLKGLLAILLTTSISARESFDEYLFADEPKTTPQPWLTGPLLTPSGHTVPHGHQNYEPYVYWTQIKGSYDDHWKPRSSSTFNNVLYQLTTQIGILPDTEFDIAPQFVSLPIAGRTDRYILQYLPTWGNSQWVCCPSWPSWVSRNISIC